MLHHTSPDNLLAEGEGEGVCCCSDLVLCLHMGHVLCIGVADGHHPVSHTDTSLSCLPTRGQLQKGNKDRRQRYMKTWCCDRYIDENMPQQAASGIEAQKLNPSYYGPNTAIFELNVVIIVIMLCLKEKIISKPSREKKYLSCQCVTT